MKSYDINQFKDENYIMEENNIYELLTKLGLNSELLSNVNVKSIFEYFNGDRMVVLMENDIENSIYITTGTQNFNSCLINVKNNELKISEAYYNRVGNGVNQEGIVVTKILSLNEKDNEQNKISKDIYAISLFFNGNKNAKLTYCGDVQNIDSAFTINVDPITLEGKGRNLNITNTLNSKLALELFKKKYLQGVNNINKNLFIIDSSEDIFSLEKGYSKRK